MKVLYNNEENSWLCLGTHKELHKLLLLDFSSKGIQDIFEEENILVNESPIHFFDDSNEIGAVSFKIVYGTFEITPIDAYQVRYEICNYDYVDVSKCPSWVRLQNVIDGK